MKHILGMAKSNLDMKGAKGPKLELDFLRLAYAVKELSSKGDSATGYLLVMTEEIAQRARSWTEKYQSGDAVVIAVANLSPTELVALRTEKENNVAGMVAGSLGNDVGSQSVAEMGRQLGERKLRKTIMDTEHKVQEIEDVNEFPLGIRWDYYGRSGAS